MLYRLSVWNKTVAFICSSYLGKNTILKVKVSYSDNLVIMHSVNTTRVMFNNTTNISEFRCNPGRIYSKYFLDCIVFISNGSLNLIEFILTRVICIFVALVPVFMPSLAKLYLFIYLFITSTELLRFWFDVLLASNRRLIFGGPVIALALTMKSLSAANWELMKPTRRPCVSLVSETGMFLWCRVV